MDPMVITGTLIATAITAGLTQGAITSVKDEAKALVRKITDKFHQPEVATALTMATEDPEDEDAREYLAKKLDKYDVAQDPDVAQATGHLTDTLDQTATGQGAVAAGSITQTITGSGSAYTGGVHITNNQTAPTAPEVRWQVTHHSGSTYAIENIGSTEALDVELSAENVARFDPPEYDNPIWPPGEPRIVFCATASMPGTPQVVIRYRTTPGGDMQERRRPLPAKP